ncbi:MAG: hypothetical protein KDN22_04040 [Verrucomicrobiae bacterium]|nr:hypothetical protein [Verrucomicrobiae bacterium]
MKSLRILIPVLAALLFTSLFAQEAPKPPVDDAKGELFTQVFDVRADFLSLGGTTEPIPDAPFTDEDSNKPATAQDILEAAGVTFPEGASVLYSQPASQLMVRNTKFNLGVIQTFLEQNSGEISEAADDAVTVRQIAIMVEYYQLDARTANRQLRDYRSTRRADATDLHDALSEMVNKKKAKRIGSGYLVTRSGQRAKIESIVEHIYPTEFDPPEVVPDLAGPVDSDVRLMTNMTPTAFETRNTGLTIEVDPVLGNDHATVDLNIAAEIAELVGDRYLGQNETRMSKPVFNTLNDSTTLTLQSGDWAFLGIHRPSPSMAELNASGAETSSSDESIIALARADVIALELDSSDSSAQTTGTVVISSLAEYIEVEEADAAELLASLAKSGSSRALREELEGRIDSGGARLIEMASVTTRSGQRAKSHSTSEWIYPTEMDPPAIPKVLKGPIKKGNNLITPLTYTAFDTRNIGTSLEVDPVTGPGGLAVDINIAPAIVAHLGENKYGSQESQAEIPVFATIKTSTAVTLRGNDPLLISVYMPINKRSRKPDPDKRVFLFLSATTLQAD